MGAIVLGACAAPWCADVGTSGAVLVTLTASAAAVAFARRASAGPILALVLISCALAGCVLTQRALAAAVIPSVRLALDQRFGGFLVEDHDGPRQSEPVLSRVVLREDAGRGDGFVSLRGHR